MGEFKEEEKEVLRFENLKILRRMALDRKHEAPKLLKYKFSAFDL